MDVQGEAERESYTIYNSPPTPPIFDFESILRKWIQATLKPKNIYGYKNKEL